jgi:hypothetical protein
MNITINRPTTICLKALMGLSIPTLNNRINHLLATICPKDERDQIRQRAREVRSLIRMDAAATLRLIQLSPSKEAGYRETWAKQADKLLSEVGMLIADKAKAYGPKMTETGFDPDLVESFAPRPVQQKEISELRLETEEPV